MGPLEGKTLELCGVADYIRYGSECPKVTIDVGRTEITTLDYSMCRSKTGFDSMLVKIGRTAFSKIGVKRYSVPYDKSIQGDVFAVGFDMSSDGDWKKLVVHQGTIIQNTNGLTAVTGTFFHTLNTEAGWSGSPIVRFQNGQAHITGMHISALPGPLPYNIAVPSPMLERLVHCTDNEFVPSLNCPFGQLASTSAKTLFLGHFFVISEMFNENNG